MVGEGLKVAWLRVERGGKVVRQSAFDFLEVQDRVALAYLLADGLRDGATFIEIEYGGRLWSVRWD